MNAWAASLALHGLGVALAATLLLEPSDAAPATPLRWQVALVAAPVEPAARVESAPLVKAAPPPRAARQANSEAPSSEAALAVPPPPATPPVVPPTDSEPVQPRPQAAVAPAPAPLPVTQPVAVLREAPVAPTPARLASQIDSVPPVALPVGVSVAAAEVAPLSRHPPAPPPPMADAAVETEKRWQSALLDSLRTLKRYPGNARRLGQEGVVLIEARISSEGRIEAATVKRGSGYPILDNDALRLLENAAAAARDRIRPQRPTRLELPIAYRLAG